MPTIPSGEIHYETGAGYVGKFVGVVAEIRSVTLSKSLSRSSLSGTWPRGPADRRS